MQLVKKLLYFLTVIWIFSACQSPTLEKITPEPAQSSNQISKLTKTTAPKKTSAQKNSVRPGLNLSNQASIDDWVSYFLASKQTLRRWFAKLNLLKPQLETILDQHQVPKEFVYLAVLESGLDPHAASRAKAKGLWQFVPKTARFYGLNVTKKKDEREDPLRSTQAAARYLSDLYEIFGDWHLVIAAYNAGPYRIKRSIKEAGSRDFWQLARTKAIGPDPAELVPKMLALVKISQSSSWEKPAVQLSSKPSTLLEASN